MLPVVASLKTTARRIVGYSVALWACSLLLVPAAGMGLVYVSAALVLGAVFLVRALQLWRERTAERAMRLFGYSISYVTLLFSAMAVDSSFTTEMVGPP
jgi:protoheme IX farnesyltransferase